MSHSPGFQSVTYLPSPHFSKTFHLLLNIGNVLCSVAGHVQLFASPRTVAHQGPLSMGFFRQEHWPVSQFSCSVVSHSLLPHGLQLARLPCHHQLPELAQTHVHQVTAAIQPSYLLSSSPPAFNFLQHQGLFQEASSSHQMATVSELQHQSFQ